MHPNPNASLTWWRHQSEEMPQLRPQRRVPMGPESLARRVRSVDTDAKQSRWTNARQCCVARDRSCDVCVAGLGFECTDTMTRLPSPEYVRAFFAKTEQPKPAKPQKTGKRFKRKAGRRMKRYQGRWETRMENKWKAKREAKAKDVFK